MLLGLSTVSSKKLFVVHKFCFVSFIASASLYMCLSIFLFSKYCGNLGYSDIGTNSETKSFYIKKRILKGSAITISSMMIFYWYHNAFCQPYVYTLFCVAEYLVVILNMAFHWCAYYDFDGLSVEIPFNLQYICRRVVLDKKQRGTEQEHLTITI